mmetsp:Transcript_2244/g.8000  ORF Transcript_2244/g.8000 Transcript_2244/m.8000 type:complete len:207 (-) Transcript_2244:1459-2079(-)
MRLAQRRAGRWQGRTKGVGTWRGHGGAGEKERRCMKRLTGSVKDVTLRMLGLAAARQAMPWADTLASTGRGLRAGGEKKYLSASTSPLAKREKRRAGENWLRPRRRSVSLLQSWLSMNAATLSCKCRITSGASFIHELVFSLFATSSFFSTSPNGRRTYWEALFSGRRARENSMGDSGSSELWARVTSPPVETAQSVSSGRVGPVE